MNFRLISISKIVLKTTQLFLMLCSLFVLSLCNAQHQKTVYIHSDALGSPIAATDSSGNLLWKETYKPYGERVEKIDGGETDLFYTGKYHEKGIGLSYFGARWYDPVVGRFTGIDPVGFKEGNIQSFNRYAYANNNPYAFVDPDGRESSQALLEQLRNNGGHLSSTKRLGDAANTLGNDVMPAAGEILGDPSNLIPGELIVGGILKGSKLVIRVTKGRPKSLKEQAVDFISQNANRNRVTLRSPSQKMEVDLAGRTHGDVPTPHTKVSPRNLKAPNQPAYNTKNSLVRPATQQDIRTVRKYLERQGQQ